ncbi:MAG: DUF551 domain-containing protein [Patescibacteria group bacterium]|jgi:hypothetical protein
MEKISDERLKELTSDKAEMQAIYYRDDIALQEKYNLAADLISTRAELAKLQEATRWVPVGERFPDSDYPVLALCYSKRAWVEIAWTDNFVDDVTHWMPLPTPPEEK